MRVFFNCLFLFPGIFPSGVSSFVLRIQRIICQTSESPPLALCVLLLSFLPVVLLNLLQFFSCEPAVRRCADALKVSRMAILASWMVQTGCNRRAHQRIRPVFAASAALYIINQYRSYPGQALRAGIPTFVHDYHEDAPFLTLLPGNVPGSAAALPATDSIHSRMRSPLPGAGPYSGVPHNPSFSTT